MTLHELATSLRTFLDSIDKPANFVDFEVRDNYVTDLSNVETNNRSVRGAYSIIWGDLSKIEASAVAAHRQFGILQLNFKCLAGIGTGILEQVVSHYQEALTSQTLNDGVTLLSASPRSLGIVNGWYEIVLSCPFEADHVISRV